MEIDPDKYAIVELNFDIKNYLGEIGKYSKLGGKISVGDKMLFLKYASYKLFYIGNELAKITETKSKYSFKPDCHFTRIIENLDKNSEAKLSGRDFDIMGLTCN